ncbi:hypothetical protein [Propionivibrio sp.]|uniref:hypothetical protein n=1 Tax=Propionivibrio sp. TaxID=2212460 RepID=UPI003457697B
MTEAAMLSVAGALLGYLLGQVPRDPLLYPVFPAFPPGWAVFAGLGLRCSRHSLWCAARKAGGEARSGSIVGETIGRQMIRPVDTLHLPCAPSPRTGYAVF